ncbi:unnamed protein product [Leptosia nina]|uniref:Uncharacterized protein n=1 Tax=Leptosia nina TaxID=320188 RepID=A0AAV1J912_9NEOP
MVARIIIAGESQCNTFAEICFIADYLSKNLPDFCYDRIEKPVLDWTAWLFKTNQKNKWHHTSSPLVWKELLTTGKSVERECSYIGTNYATKVLKYVEKIGLALTNTDILIILDHIPFSEDQAIGDWLHDNKKLMQKIALMINASASSKMKIILPNLGPACYNATVLSQSLTHISKHNIIVATSDLGMEVTPIIAKMNEIPMRNIFCPPVWGFVGINHLIDINNTIHRYDAFEPYERYRKVRNSSLCIGTLTPEMRTMEYLTFFDESLWVKVAEEKVD